MRRSPSWSRPSDLWGSWTSQARCAGHLDLPWTAELAPSAQESEQMAAVCEGCPVIEPCARYALSTNGRRGADGGYYAGVWLPWSSSGGVRARARRQLRALTRQRIAVMITVVE